MGTFILHIESFNNALKVVRPKFILLLYFYLRAFKKKDFKIFVKWAFVATFIQGIFYYMQLVGVNVLSGRVDEADSVGELTRFANYPIMAAFFVIYYVISEKVTAIHKLFVFSFFGMMLIIAQMRGAVIGLGAALALFFLLKRHAKYIGYIAVGIVAYLLVVAPMFEYRTRNKSRSTFQEITDVVTDPTNTYSQFYRYGIGGNFSFRIAMLAERVKFVIDKPEYIPFGVGCIHEESKANKFFFQLGTHNERFRFGYGMLSSADIAWVGLLMRFGIIGVILHLLLFYAWARQGIPQVKKSDDPLLITCAVLVVSQFLTSFDSDILGRIPPMMSILFYLAVIYRYNRVRLFTDFISKHKENNISYNFYDN